MKRVTILLALMAITVGTVGCAHRLRDWFYQGSYCGSATAPVVTAPMQYAAPTCCPPACGVEPGCEAPCTTYGQAYDGAMMSPAPQTFVAPSPE